VQSIYWVNTGSAPTPPGSTAFGPGGDGSIVSIALDGGAPRVLASSQNQPSTIAVDDSFVYFTAVEGTSADGGAGCAVFSIPIAGGAPALLVSGIGSGEAVAARGGDVVFAAVTPGDGGAGGSVIVAPSPSPANVGILSVPLAGGTPTPVLPNVASVSVFANR
jgi:hypothetical protein